jgi:predicted transcriptional regulator of viral defense system
MSNACEALQLYLESHEAHSPLSALVLLKGDKMRYFEHMPTDRFALLAELAADQHGLFTLEDAREIGYRNNTIAQMARRGRVTRVSHSVYRIPFLPEGPLGAYMEAALWPVGVRGVLSHATALDLWDVSDANPAKVHVTVPRTHRPQRVVPEAYVVHREDLAREEIAAVERVPVVTLDRAVRECASDGIGRDLLVQAVREGRARGLLTAEQATALARELDLGRIAETRA